MSNGPLAHQNVKHLARLPWEPQGVEKPWGHELIWALSDDYAGKLLAVKAGHQLSLQFHREKDESWYLLEGRAELEFAEPGETMTISEVVVPGAAFRIKPGTVHRIRALEDTVMLEVSTPHLDDVVPLDAAYGRSDAPGKP